MILTGRTRDGQVHLAFIMEGRGTTVGEAIIIIGTALITDGTLMAWPTADMVMVWAMVAVTGTTIDTREQSS